MNYKKKSLIISILLIISIQLFLLINNKQKSSFRYFIWNIQNVSIGRLIFISYISGLIFSSILNTTHNFNTKSNLINAEEDITNDNEYSSNTEDDNNSSEIPPERDLRDTQPTISVNYRVIKNNDENDSKDRNQTSNNRYQDDWYKKDTEW